MLDPKMVFTRYISNNYFTDITWNLITIQLKKIKLTNEKQRKEFILFQRDHNNENNLFKAH